MVNAGKRRSVCGGSFHSSSSLKKLPDWPWHLISVKLFRQGVYTLLGNGKDALFDLMDAVLVTRSVYSFVELSVSPVFRRQWSSIYEAIEDGLATAPRIDAVLHRTATANRATGLSRRSHSLAKTKCAYTQRPHLRTSSATNVRSQTSDSWSRLQHYSLDSWSRRYSNSQGR